jgi:hypothetical protein
MNNFSKYEIELKNSNSCIKKCYSNDILPDFKKCYISCTFERREKDIMLYNYVRLIIRNIKNPQKVSNNTNKNLPYKSDYDLPDWYYKAKLDDFQPDPKKQVGAFFGKNK